jgi:2-polyprenyl-3-methyl-5-hydroxy-6-metoxy-1,4-benzoquinol methylase
MMGSALTAAAKAWDVSKETIEQINRRIHDGVAIENLNERADAYIKTIRTLFPYVEFDIQHALEIGSGLGFIMEAMERATSKAKNRKQIVGLDISSSMIDAAKSRLSDSPKRDLFSFSLYDGVSMPFADESFDLVSQNLSSTTSFSRSRGFCARTDMPLCIFSRSHAYLSKSATGPGGKR